MRNPLVLCTTQLADVLNKLFSIAQPYFPSDIIRKSWCQLLFVAFKTVENNNFPTKLLPKIKILIRYE